MNRDRKIQQKLDELVEQRCAYGMQLSLGYKDRHLGTFCSGQRDPSRKGPVRSSTLFDLASLTKIISTVSLLMFLRQKSKIESYQMKLQQWIPSLQSDLKNRTLYELLHHTAGLSKVFEKTEELHDSRDDRFRYFLSQVDAEYTGEGLGTTIYSDVGYMLLGYLIEKISERRLGDLFLETFGDRETLLYGPVQYPLQFLSRFFDIPNVASSQSLGEPCFKLRGIPQDPRSQWLGGDAGHAGLFGTAEAIEKWGRDLWMGYQGKGLKFSDRVVRELLDGERISPRFRGGFDTPTPPSQAGSLADAKSVVGHLGYTGASFWMDLEKGWRISLVSHRHAPAIDPGRLQEMRPQLHDWLLQNIFSDF